MRKFMVFSLVVFFHSYCDKPSPDRFFSEEERKADLVIKEVYRDNEKSSHIILMNGAEKPHFHDRHSFEVTLVKGTLHYAENTGPGYSILSVNFYPPFDGKDRRFSKK